MADDTRSTSVTDPPNAASPAAPETRPAPEGRATYVAPPEPRSGRWKLFAVAAVVLLVVGIFVWRYLNTYESTDDAQVDGHLSQISARVSGYITKVNVEDNQLVQKGDVLIEMDPKDYQVAVARAQAELADAEATAQASNLNVPVTSIGTSSQISSAQADVQTTQAGVTAAQHQVQAAQARVQEAEANNERAQADLKRYSDLVAKDEVSRQVYDQAAATAKSNAAAVDGAQQALAAAEQQVMEAQGRVAQTQAALTGSSTGPQQVLVMRARARSADAMVQQKRAALEQAQLNLQYCTVVAPVSGVVKKNVEVGVNAQIGQPLLSIAEIDDVWVTANFKENQLERIRPGQKVTLSVDAYGRNYTGKVESVAGASGARYSLLPPENATGNYVKVVQRLPVKIVLDPGQNSDHLLRLGMSVTPKVSVQ